MAELFKFRCSQCEKLLGVSPKKAGRTVQCPRCGTELIVPIVETASDSLDLQPLDESLELGIDLGLASPLDLQPSDRARSKIAEPAVVEVEAISFLERIAGTEDVEPANPGSIVDSEPSASYLEGPDADLDPEPLVQTPVEPLVSQARRSRGHQASIDRRRDVVIPRTAVVAWSIFALLALACSFVAGLMIGHYRWK